MNLGLANATAFRNCSAYSRHLTPTSYRLLSVLSNSGSFRSVTSRHPLLFGPSSQALNVRKDGLRLSSFGGIRRESVRNYSITHEFSSRFSEDDEFKTALRDFKGTWPAKTTVYISKLISRVLSRVLVSLPLWIVKNLGFNLLSKLLRRSITWILWSNPAVSRVIRPGIVHAATILSDNDPHPNASNSEVIRDIIHLSTLEDRNIYTGPKLETSCVALVPYRGSFLWRLGNSLPIRLLIMPLLLPVRFLAWLWSPVVRLWRYETDLASALRLAKTENPGFSLEQLVTQSREIIPVVSAAEYAQDEINGENTDTSTDVDILRVLCGEGLYQQLALNRKKHASTSNVREKFLHISSIELLSGRVEKGCDLPQFEFAVQGQVFKDGGIWHQVSVWLLQLSPNRRHFQVVQKVIQAETLIYL